MTNSVKFNVLWRIRQSQMFGRVEAKNHSMAVATELSFNEDMAQKMPELYAGLC